MKNKVIQFYLLFVLTAFLTVTLRAQTPEYRTYIPFDFNVGNKNLPAGDYAIALVDFIESRNVLTIRETNSKESQTIMFFPKSRESVTSTEIAFNRYDKEYFLTEIISPAIHGEFSRTSAETRLAETQNPERITVAMKK